MFWQEVYKQVAEKEVAVQQVDGKSSTQKLEEVKIPSIAQEKKTPAVEKQHSSNISQKSSQERQEEANRRNQRQRQYYAKFNTKQSTVPLNSVFMVMEARTGGSSCHIKNTLRKLQPETNLCKLETQLPEAQRKTQFPRLSAYREVKLETNLCKSETQLPEAQRGTHFPRLSQREVRSETNL